MFQLLTKVVVVLVASNSLKKSLNSYHHADRRHTKFKRIGKIEGNPKWVGKCNLKVNLIKKETKKYLVSVNSAKLIHSGPHSLANNSGWPDKQSADPHLLDTTSSSSPAVYEIGWSSPSESGRAGLRTYKEWESSTTTACFEQQNRSKINHLWSSDVQTSRQWKHF